MQRGVGHVPTIPSLRNTYLAIHTWATTQTFSSLHRCTAKASQHSLHNGLSGQVQRRFKHGKNKKPDDAKTQEKKPPWPKGFKPSPFEKRLPWADTNWDIVKGNVDWKYMKTKRYADSQASRPEWDYEVQLEENPEHARYLKLWINAAWFLRILAKDQGFYVAPDGFVRISDAVSSRMPVVVFLFVAAIDASRFCSHTDPFIVWVASCAFRLSLNSAARSLREGSSWTRMIALKLRVCLTWSMASYKMFTGSGQEQGTKCRYVSWRS